MVGMGSASRTSPDLESARRRHLAWVQHFGLARSREKLEQYERWRIADLPAFIYPDAAGHDLDVAVDALGWFTLLDDQFDGYRRHRTAELRYLRDELLACLAGRPAGHRDIPLVRAWADLCPRMLDEMSDTWAERITACWRDHFDACIAEEGLAADTPDAVSRYLSVRRISVGGYLGTVLMERALRCEIPEFLWGAAQIPVIRQGVADIALFLNDICSLPREIARGDRINLVILLQSTLGYSRAQAVDDLNRRVEDAVALIGTQQRDLLNACSTLWPGTPQLATAHRFVTGTNSIVCGLRDWYAVTGRYAGAETAGDNGFRFENLLSALR